MNTWYVPKFLGRRKRAASFLHVFNKLQRLQSYLSGTLPHCLVLLLLWCDAFCAELWEKTEQSDQGRSNPNLTVECLQENRTARSKESQMNFPWPSVCLIPGPIIGIALYSVLEDRYSVHGHFIFIFIFWEKSASVYQTHDLVMGLK